MFSSEGLTTLAIQMSALRAFSIKYLPFNQLNIWPKPQKNTVYLTIHPSHENPLFCPFAVGLSEP